MIARTVGVTLACLTGIIASPTLGQPARQDPPKPAEQAARPGTQAPGSEKVPAAAPIREVYPLPTCPQSGERLGSMGDPVVRVYEGREVRFCCKSCPPKFEKELAKSLSTLDEAIIKDQASLYPLATSVVTGKALPASPIEFVYRNRLVRVGAEPERAEFLKDPARHLDALDAAAVAAQGKDYPLKACPISKEQLGSMGKPVEVVVAGRLVRLCCTSCVKDLRKDPMASLGEIQAAKKPEKGQSGVTPPGEPARKGK